MKKYFSAFYLSLLFSKIAYGDQVPLSTTESASYSINNKQKNNHAVDPIKIKADTVSYDNILQLITAVDNVKINYQNYELIADRLVYDVQHDTVRAYGHIIAKNFKNVVAYGDYIELKKQFKEAIIKNLLLSLPKDVQVTANSALKNGENFTVLKDATYTPCPVCKFNYPQWQFRAHQTAIDFSKQTVVYRHVYFEVYGIPIFYSPYLSHPTPGADARSGILTPEIQGNSIKIPLYLLLKPNLDVTITPRLLRHKTIYEGELRHKLTCGDYEISGSILKDTRSKNEENKNLKRAPKAYRYYIRTNGNFTSLDKYNYGFMLEQTSDKSYMKNYGYDGKSYLTSKLYLNNIDYYNYYTIEALKFQGLRQNDTSATDAHIFPHIFYKHFIPLKDLPLTINLETDLLVYKQPNHSNSNRGMFKIVTTQRLLNKHNHIIDASLYLRTDLYSATSLQNEHGNNIFAKNNPITRHNTNRIFFIPEQHTSWRYQALQLTNYGYFEYEPQVLLVLSGCHHKYKAHLLNTDSQILELRDDNLFQNNRYSGIDRHEAGSKLSYGMKFTLFDNNSKLKSSMFLGQLYRLTNDYNIIDRQSGFARRNSNIVGRLNISFDHDELYYKFTKDPITLATETDEIGFAKKINKININISYNAIRNYNDIENTPRIRQINFNLNYNFTKKLQIGYVARRNLSANATKKLMDYGISVTYTGECVKITGKFVNNYTFDNSRGIKKNRSGSFILGLRTINY